MSYDYDYDGYNDYDDYEEEELEEEDPHAVTSCDCSYCVADKKKGVLPVSKEFPWEDDRYKKMEHYIPLQPLRKYYEDGEKIGQFKTYQDVWPHVEKSHDPVVMAADLYLLFGISSGVFVQKSYSDLPEEATLRKSAEILGLSDETIAQRMAEYDSFKESHPTHGLKKFQNQAAAEYETLVNKYFDCFFEYTLMAIGGELRHGLRAYSSYDSDRSTAWVFFWYLYQEYGVKALLMAEECFLTYWKGSTAYGGPKWAVPTRLAIDYLDGKLGLDPLQAKQVFLDRVVTLQHNTGSFLNKIKWQNQRASRAWPYDHDYSSMGDSSPEFVLGCHSASPTNISGLWGYASPEVQTLTDNYFDLAVAGGSPINGKWNRSKNVKVQPKPKKKVEVTTKIDWAAVPKTKFKRELKEPAIADLSKYVLPKCVDNTQFMASVIKGGYVGDYLYSGPWKQFFALAYPSPQNSTQLAAVWDMLTSEEDFTNNLTKFRELISTDFDVDLFDSAPWTVEEAGKAISVLYEMVGAASNTDPFAITCLAMVQAIFEAFLPNFDYKQDDHWFSMYEYLFVYTKTLQPSYAQIADGSYCSKLFKDRLGEPYGQIAADVMIGENDLSFTEFRQMLLEAAQSGQMLTYSAPSGSLLNKLWGVHLNEIYPVVTVPGPITRNQMIKQAKELLKDLKSSVTKGAELLNFPEGEGETSPENKWIDLQTLKDWEYKWENTVWAHPQEKVPIIKHKVSSIANPSDYIFHLLEGDPLQNKGTVVAFKDYPKCIAHEEPPAMEPQTFIDYPGQPFESLSKYATYSSPTSEEGK